MPMTMPSIVKTERILPCVRLRVAVLKASLNSILFEKFFFRGARVFDRLFALELSVLEPDDTVGELGGVRFVRDQNDRVSFAVESFENFHDLRARLRVEIAR